MIKTNYEMKNILNLTIIIFNINILVDTHYKHVLIFLSNNEINKYSSLSLSLSLSQQGMGKEKKIDGKEFG